MRLAGTLIIMLWIMSHLLIIILWSPATSLSNHYISRQKKNHIKPGNYSYNAPSLAALCRHRGGFGGLSPPSPPPPPTRFSGSIHTTYGHTSFETDIDKTTVLYTHF